MHIIEISKSHWDIDNPELSNFYTAYTLWNVSTLWPLVLPYNSFILFFYNIKWIEKKKFKGSILMLSDIIWTSLWCIGIVNMDLILCKVTSNNAIMMTKNIRNDIKQTSNWHNLMIFDINLTSFSKMTSYWPQKWFVFFVFCYVKMTSNTLKKTSIWCWFNVIWFAGPRHIYFKEVVTRQTNDIKLTSNWHLFRLFDVIMT